MTIDRKKMLPFILTAAVIILDQITKAFIVKNIPVFTIGYSFFGDFLRAAGACPPFSQQTRPTATPADAFLCANFSFLTKSLTNMSSQVYTMPIL